MTVTRKGQVTIPAPIRKQMAINVGGRVSFVVEGDTVTVEPAEDWATRTAGIFAGTGPELTAEELDDAIDQAWADAAAERDERSKQR